MLHYYAKEFFAQILISPWVTEKGNLAVKIVSDKRSGPPLKVTLETHIYSWNSTTPVANITSNQLRLVSKLINYFLLETYLFIIVNLTLRDFHQAILFKQYVPLSSFLSFKNFTISSAILK